MFPNDGKTYSDPDFREIDDDAGMAWWNALTEPERDEWMRRAGNTGRAKDAWEAYKAILSIHSSDCAVHNEPAMRKGPCNCGEMEVEVKRLRIALQSIVDNKNNRNWRKPECVY